MADEERLLTGTIVVGVDGSDASVAAARWACRLAALAGSAVELVTAWQWPISWGPAMPLPDDYDPAADTQAMVDEIAGVLSRGVPRSPARTRARSRAIPGWCWSRRRTTPTSSSSPAGATARCRAC